MRKHYEGLLDFSTRSSDLGFLCVALLKTGHCTNSISRHTAVDGVTLEKMANEGIKHGYYPAAVKKLESEFKIQPFCLNVQEFATAHRFVGMQYKEIEFKERMTYAKHHATMTLAIKHRLDSEYGSEENWPEDYRSQKIVLSLEEQKKEVLTRFKTNLQCLVCHAQDSVLTNIVNLSFIYFDLWSWEYSDNEATVQELYEEVASFYVSEKPTCINDFFEQCKCGPKLKTTPKELFGAYCDWCQANDLKVATTVQGLGKILKNFNDEIVVKREQSGKVRTKVYVGISVK